MSDTVIAVSTGRNGVLGTGTNAPLYTSTFLNRADPEAELAAYERRLALALDVDQTDRILQHSPLLSAVCKPMQSDMAKHAKPAWRDGAWIKDGVISSLSTCASIAYYWVLLTLQQSSTTVPTKPTKTSTHLAVQICSFRLFIDAILMLAYSARCSSATRRLLLHLARLFYYCQMSRSWSRKFRALVV